MTARKAYAAFRNPPSPACQWEQLQKKEMNMKKQNLPRKHAPKLKDALLKVKEVLARCACLFLEMVIAVARLLCEGHAAAFLPQRATKIHKAMRRHFNHEETRMATKPCGGGFTTKGAWGAAASQPRDRWRFVFCREGPLRAAKTMRRIHSREGPKGHEDTQRPCGGLLW